MLNLHVTRRSVPWFAAGIFDIHGFDYRQIHYVPQDVRQVFEWISAETLDNLHHVDTLQRTSCMRYA